MDRRATTRTLAASLLRDLIRNRTAIEIADAIEVMIDAAIDEALDRPEGPLGGDLRALGVLPSSEEDGR